jgi:hypothetical protein
LRIQVRRRRDYPPAVLVRMNVPHLKLKIS